MFTLYRKLIASSIRAQMQYKLNFLSSAVTSGLIMVLDFAVLSAILYRFHDIAGWNLYEVGILYGISSAAVSLYRLFAPEIHDFDRYVIQGELDQLLIRPVSPLVLLLTRNLDLTRIGGVVQGLAILAISLSGMFLQGESIWLLLMFIPVAIISGSVVYFSIGLATAAASFWLHQVKDLQTFTLYAPANASNYPVGLYPGWLKWLFFSVIPIAYINYVPMLALLGKGGSWYDPLLAPFVAGAALFAAVCIWRRGIRRYHSTGS
ncbi:ABC transporter permease [Brevibacillus sp. GCM10020057]|uniref:ABC transporter permease n=1 Tax=Brevibacillus sp. GCM10020057 TaxID=3317327 RepID=UPI0036341E1B